MAESTQTASDDGTPTAAKTGYGYCHWHQAYARGVRLVQVLEQSGNGNGSYFACRPCREAYGLVPFADQP